MIELSPNSYGKEEHFTTVALDPIFRTEDSVSIRLKIGWDFNNNNHYPYPQGYYGQYGYYYGYGYYYYTGVQLFDTTIRKQLSLQKVDDHYPFPEGTYSIESHRGNFYSKLSVHLPSSDRSITELPIKPFYDRGDVIGITYDNNLITVNNETKKKT